jgi:site-specific DNA-methyltransferase (adenine-specific)
MAFLLVDEKGNQQVKKKDKGAEKVNFLDENINKIINADCLDIFKQLPDKCIDLVLTDPPYGIGNKFTSEYGLQERKSKRGSFSWNDKIPEKEVFDEIIRVSKNQIIFGGNYFTEYLKPTKSWLVWDKIGQYDLKNPFSDCELAWTSFSCTTKKYTFVNMGFIAGKEEKGKRIHPTQKPLQLFQAILQDFSKPGDIVLDPFSGSGTTAVAAHKLGRKFICIEKAPDYWAASIKRLEEAHQQLSIFDYLNVAE